MLLGAVNAWTEFVVAMLQNGGTCVTYGEDIRPGVRSLGENSQYSDKVRFRLNLG